MDTTSVDIKFRLGARLSDMDPIHYDKDKEAWYFYDETWADQVGPFETEEEARKALDLYVTEVLG